MKCSLGNFSPGDTSHEGLKTTSGLLCGGSHFPDGEFSVCVRSVTSISFDVLPRSLGGPREVPAVSFEVPAPGSLGGPLEVPAVSLAEPAPGFCFSLSFSPSFPLRLPLPPFPPFSAGTLNESPFLSGGGVGALGMKVELLGRFPVSCPEGSPHFPLEVIRSPSFRSDAESPTFLRLRGLVRKALSEFLSQSGRTLVSALGELVALTDCLLFPTLSVTQSRLFPQGLVCNCGDL